MTNKLPKVGKRYKWKQIGNSTVTIISIYDDYIIYDCNHYDDEILIDIDKCHKNDFWKEFEEIPSETKEKPKSQEKDEVQVALEELKKEVNKSAGFWIQLSEKEKSEIFNLLQNLSIKAQDLVDALEKQNLRDKEVSQSEVETTLAFKSNDESGELTKEYRDLILKEKNDTK